MPGGTQLRIDTSACDLPPEGLSDEPFDPAAAFGCGRKKLWLGGHAALHCLVHASDDLLGGSTCLCGIESAPDHISRCAYCFELAKLVTQRDRVPSHLPVGFLAGALQWARSRLSTRSGQITVAVTGVAVRPLSFVVSSPPPDLSVGGDPAFPLQSDTLPAHAGDEAVADGVRVESVPADEAFWVGRDEQQRVLVHLVGEGDGSGVPPTALPSASSRQILV